MSKSLKSSSIFNRIKSHFDNKIKSDFDEHLLQYSRPGKNGDCELVIGLDFGTSASKVAIQTPDLPGSSSYVVDFGEFSHVSAKYLLPTKIWVTQNGVCSLSPQENSKLVNDIKIDLLHEDKYKNSNRGPRKQGLSGEEIAVAYLALLLRYVRKWFLETKREIIEHFNKLNWSLNLGVPSPCIEDNEENRCFKRVGKAAWMLSILEEEITIEKARQKLIHIDEIPEDWELDDNGLTCDFKIIPEIAAGAVGYALSDIRREGLHVMVDIGASTVDVCSFILPRSDEDAHYSLLTTDVQFLGTIRLHIDRILTLQKTYEKQAEALRDKHDPLTPIAEDIEPYLIPRDKLEEEIRKAETNLKKQFQIMLRRIICDAKQRRDPNSPVWDKGRLPILLIGGGSKLSFFFKAVEELDDWLKKKILNNGAMLLKDERIPERLKSETGVYHRLAVAYGLSHRALDIGKITPADQISDIDDTPTILDIDDWYISKDQV